jgi:hypothetical protein
MYVPDIDRKIPTVPLDANRDNLILRKFRKTLEIPFTDIDDIEIDVRISPVVLGPPVERYVMKVLLRNGRKYEQVINPFVFESVYGWAKEKGIISEEKERERLKECRENVMRKAEEYSHRIAKISLITFLFLVFGSMIILYSARIFSPYKLISGSLLLTFAGFILFLHGIALTYGIGLKSMLKTFIYRKRLFQKVFKTNSGVDFDYEEFFTRKKRSFKVPMVLYIILGTSLILLSPFSFGTRAFPLMLFTGIISLGVGLFLWRN